jgi:excisionase family DNA binding protein
LPYSFAAVNNFKTVVKMNNPFELIEARLSSIENLLLDIKHQPQGTPQPQPERKYSAPETAEYLGINISTLYIKVSKGELPACKAPGSKRLFFFEKDLENYLKSGRKKTNAEVDADAEAFILNRKGGKIGK